MQNAVQLLVHWQETTCEVFAFSKFPATINHNDSSLRGGPFNYFGNMPTSIRQNCLDMRPTSVVNEQPNSLKCLKDAGDIVIQSLP